MAALLGASPARFGAPPAVLGFMFRAFRAASLANFGANAAEIGGELRTTAHEGRGPPADFGTVSIESHTFRHFLHVVLTKASVGAVLARLRAHHAGLDAGRISFMSHCVLSFVL